MITCYTKNAISFGKNKCPMLILPVLILSFLYAILALLTETGTVVNDGLHEIFVNTAIDDKSDIAEVNSKSRGSPIT